MSNLETMQWIAHIKTFRGRYIDGDGYIHVKRPHHQRANKKGYVREHIVIFEGVHKCSLLKWGDVHHIDGNKQHNDWLNLEGLSHGQHASITNKKPTPERTCLRCGRDTRKVMTKKRRNPHVQWHSYMNGHICHACKNMLDYYRKKGLNMANFLSSSRLKAKSAFFSS